MKFLTKAARSAVLPLLAAAFFAAGSSGAAAAGDVAAGETKAAPCATCHGAGGNAPIADYPKLAGQARKYLLYTLRAYKSGARPNAVMAAQTAPLSDEDLQDLAAYFAAQSGDLR